MQRKKKIFLVLVAILSAYLIWVLISVTNNKDIDQIPKEESSEIDYSNQAYIVKGDKLFYAIGSPERYDFLGKDLYLFGKSNYEKYIKADSGVIGFEITSDIKTNQGGLSFQGRFGANKNKIDVSVKYLKKNRLTTSITDVKQSINIDADLPSNTKRNQFIGILPLVTSNFNVEYADSSNMFTVTIFNSAKNLELAQSSLLESLGVDSLTNENIYYDGAVIETPSEWF